MANKSCAIRFRFASIAIDSILLCLIFIAKQSIGIESIEKIDHHHHHLLDDLDLDRFDHQNQTELFLITNKTTNQRLNRRQTKPNLSYSIGSNANRYGSSSNSNTNLAIYRPGRCYPNVCLNDGQCIVNPNTLKSYCRCPPRFVGSSCEYQNPCFGNNRCFNGGTCQPIISPNQPPSFKCLCPLGFSASMCEVEVPNICQRKRPCRNNGRCVLHTDLEHYQCNCISGWRGERCEERDNCASSPCKNNALCISNTNGTGFTCECQNGFRGNTCAEDINECLELGDDLACNQKGQCINVPGSYVCNCEAGYTGQRCETVYIPCQSDNPCQNGGDCIADHLSKTYQCSCPVGFTGRNCEINIDDCGGHLCQNGGTCLDDVNTYTCICPSNFTGPYCSQDVDECSLQPQPCQNGATCANTIGGFNCICVNGWTGQTCSENIDDCANAPCFNGATCHDRVGSYYCQCPPGKTGLLCHLDDACASNPCHTGAICDTSPVDGTYVCSCPVGYKGTDCMQDIDECHDRGSPCEHGGTCVNTPGSYRCDCAVGFAGTRCEVNINECDSNPCQNEGTCLDERGSYRCVCMPGYTGVHCESNIDECLSNPCQNHAICTDLINGYRCLCTNGFDGVNCEKMIDQCYKNPCRNNGTCHNEIQLSHRQETSVCTCPEGFDGRYCEYNINDCESNPCFYGKCVDMINSFKCICNPGYTGILCQSQINECQSNPCASGGTCIDELNGYKCECPNGTYGINCQYQENECWSNPCLNGGTCHDMTNKYRCQCASGFRGEQCEIMIDHCLSNPCANGGTCYMLMANNYKCICPKGFHGPRCLSDVDECSPNPCLNGGICEDDVNKFTCHCSPGYTGFHCESLIDQCSQVQCQNGGTCINQPFPYASNYPFSTFRCQCRPNFAGLYCEIDQKSTLIDQKRRNAWARCPKADFCYEHFSDNICNEECNIRDCLFDGFDCRNTDFNGNSGTSIGSHDGSPSNSLSMVNHSNIQFDQCNRDYNPYCEDNYANGHCDYGCNIAECAWDGLDCENDPSSTDYLRGELIIDINFPFNQMNETNPPAPVKKLIRMLSILIGSVLRIREIREINYHDTKLIMAIDNRKCRKTGQCFENSQEVASFLTVSQNRQASPVKQFLRKSGIQMHFDAVDEVRDSFMNPNNQAHNLTYIVIGFMTLLFVGILLGALMSNKTNKVARGITWFPEGFFTNQIPSSRSGRHHSNMNASAAAASGDFGRHHRRGGNHLGLAHTNSIRSGCPDGQEMRQFKTREDMIDEKSPCAAAIYEEPSECRSWSSAHYEAFQPHDSLTPPLPTPSIDAIGPNGMTPLMVASAFPNVINFDNPEMVCDKTNAVKDLLNNGANVSLTCDKTNETCLHLAARYARADAAKHLIESGADCNAQDATGRTPLHAAIAADARGVFEILLRNRTVDLNAKTNDGTTPLILAARMANEGMLEQLVLHNCDLNAIDEAGKTALHWAASVNNVEAVRVLLQNGIDRDCKNNREETPLFLAAREGAYQCAKLLLDYHANRDITDNMDQLPRDVALARMHTDIVDLLDKHEPSSLPNLQSLYAPGSNLSNPITSPIPTTWSTMGRNTAPRRKPVQQSYGVNNNANENRKTPAHHQSNLNLALPNINANSPNNNEQNDGSLINPNLTLNKSKKSSNSTNTNNGGNKMSADSPMKPSMDLDNLISNAPPPPPPPRNCVALYDINPAKMINTAKQPILLLGCGAPNDNLVEMKVIDDPLMIQQQTSPLGTVQTITTNHHQNQPSFNSFAENNFQNGGNSGVIGSNNHENVNSPSNNNNFDSINASNSNAAFFDFISSTNTANTSNDHHVGHHHHHHHHNHHQHQYSISGQSENVNSNRPTPIFDDYFGKKHHQQSQPIAVAPRHPNSQQQNGLPPTPTATTAPTSLSTTNMPHQKNQTMLCSEQQQQQQHHHQYLHQSMQQPKSAVNNSYNYNQQSLIANTGQQPSSQQQQQQQHLRPFDSYPTPSPDSWGSLSTSSPLSSNDWIISGSNSGGGTSGNTGITNLVDEMSMVSNMLFNTQGPQPGQTLSSGQMISNGILLSPTSYNAATPTNVMNGKANSALNGMQSVTAVTQTSLMANVMQAGQDQLHQQHYQHQSHNHVLGSNTANDPLMMSNVNDSSYNSQTATVNGSNMNNNDSNNNNNNNNNNNSNNNNHSLHQPRFQPSSTQQAVFI